MENEFVRYTNIGTCVGGGFKGEGFKIHDAASCVCVTKVLLAMLVKVVNAVFSN